MGRSRRGGRGGGIDGIRGSLQGAQLEYLPMLQRVCGVTGPTFEGRGGGHYYMYQPPCWPPGPGSSPEHHVVYVPATEETKGNMLVLILT